MWWLLTLGLSCSYDLLSQGWFTHATPTLFNAGTPNPQLSSCFLVQMRNDSIDGIYDTLKVTLTLPPNPRLPRRYPRCHECRIQS